MRFLIPCLALLGVYHAAAAAVVIDFEDWAGGGGIQNSIVSNGYVFNGVFSITPDPGGGNPTNALHSLLYTLKTGIGGPTFAVTSVDIQEGFGSSDTVAVRLVGYFPGAGQVAQTFELDGLLDTYETFHPVGFSGIEQLYFDAYNIEGAHSIGGFSVDNIVVPEPMAFWLIAASILAIRKAR